MSFRQNREDKSKNKPRDRAMANWTKNKKIPISDKAFFSPGNKHIFLMLFCFLSLFYPTKAEFEDKGVGARPLGMGLSYFALADDVYSLFWNPAGLAGIDKRQIISGSGKLFGLSDLSHDFAGAAQPLYGWSNMGITYQRFGGPKYEESVASLVFAYRMGKTVKAGIGFKTMHTSIEDTPRRGGYGVDVGFLAEIAQNTRLGFVVVNGDAYYEGSEPPRVYKLGISMDLDPRFTFLTGISRTETNTRKFETAFHVGQEYKMGDNFTIRSGWDTKPAVLSAGFGFIVRTWAVDYCYRTHPYLPSSHIVSVGMGF